MDEQVLQILESCANQDPSARERLMPLVYVELRRLAHHSMRGERENHTPQTTGLAGGLTAEDTADVLNLSPPTVKRERASAMARLHQDLLRRAGLGDAPAG